MLDHSAIRAIMPHGHPILLIDAVDELDPFRRIVARKAISGCEPCFAGLKSDLSMEALAYPRPLLIESFGQAGGILWLESLRREGDRQAGQLVFAALRNVRFHRSVFPGDVIRQTVEVDHIIGNNFFVSGAASVRDDPVVTFGEAIVSIRPQAELISAR
ncbi:3-hydroxyacyl-ACP dehydratase FabZ family protein [Nocardia sp. NPDC051052]|uniref:3-hydroxyacyl-ACP dehydratase FabZ family protein n=1 Tax=Nocardia sp. NPDC051052 TaxID=3364322 RepID=UPI0037B57E71